MGIGTSLGAYFEDEHHYHSALWDPEKYDSDKGMVITPNERMTNQALDQAELDPTTGLGIEVGYKIPVAKDLGLQGAEITDDDINKAIDIGLGAATVGTAERVGRAALRVKGELFTGNSHGEAFENFMNKYPEGDIGKFEDGFVTTHGRFVSRDEALNIARNTKQIPKDLKANTMGLTSEDLSR